MAMELSQSLFVTLKGFKCRADCKLVAALKKVTPPPRGGSALPIFI